MNTQGGPLEFEYDIKLENMQAKLKNIEGQLMSMGQNVQKQGNLIDKAWAMSMASVAGYFTGRTLVNFVQDIFQVRAEFQKLEAILTNSFGDESAAKRALSMIQEFASKTPYQVTDLTASFVKLVNQGFTPTMEEMTKLGDLASSTGKGFDQLTEAIIDAQTFEFERLKEFGVRAKKEGDKITFTFKEQETQVKATSEEVRKYILSLGGMEGVAGTMEQVSKTLGGQISNLGDAWDKMLNTLGSKSQGVFATVIGWLNDMITMIDGAIISIDQIREKVYNQGAETNTQAGLEEIHDLERKFVESGMKVDAARKKAYELYSSSIQKTIESFTNLQKQESEKLYQMYANNQDDDKTNDYSKKQLNEQVSIIDGYITKAQMLRDELTGVTEILKKRDAAIATTQPVSEDEKALALAKKRLEALAKQTEEKLRQEAITKRTNDYEHDNRLSGDAAEKFIDKLEEEQRLRMKNLNAEKEKYEQIMDGVAAQKQLNSLLNRAATISSIISQRFSGVSGAFGDVVTAITEQVDRIATISANFDIIGDPSASLNEKIYAGVDSFAAVAAQIASTIQQLNALAQEQAQGRMAATLDALTFAIDKLNRAASAGTIENYNKQLAEIAKTGQSIQSNYISLSLDQIEASIAHYERRAADEGTWNDKNIQANLLKYQEMRDLKLKELEIQQKIRDTTGSTVESLTDAITSAFTESYDVIDEFADRMQGTFEDAIKTAMIKAWQLKYLEPSMDKWMAYFTKTMGDGSMSEEEYAFLQTKWDAFNSMNADAWANLEKFWKDNGIIGGSESGSSSTLSKSIQGITEDTADVIAGQMNAIKVIGIQQRDIMQTGLLHWQRIDYNTGVSAKLLVDVVLGLGAVKSTIESSSDRASGL